MNIENKILIKSNIDNNVPCGVLEIKDTHLTDTPPSARQDDYFKTVTNKLSKTIEYANKNNLLATISGDVFHRYKENNVVINTLINILNKAKYKVIIIPGNHDLSSRVLSDKDSLSIIKSSTTAHVCTSNDDLYYFVLENGKTVGIGGTPYGQELPSQVDWDVDYGLWLTHHNLPFANHYTEESITGFKEINGIHEVFNGHLHHQSPDVIKNNTIYHNFGAITRTKKDESDRVPSFVVWKPDCECKVIFLKNDLTEHAFYGSGRVNAKKSIIAEAGDAGKRFIDFLSNPDKKVIDLNEEFDNLLKAGEIDKKIYDFLLEISSIAKKEVGK